MNELYETNYVLDEVGNLDVNYYINQAKELRSQTFKAESGKLIAAVKQRLNNLTTILFHPKAA